MATEIFIRTGYYEIISFYRWLIKKVEIVCKSVNIQFTRNNENYQVIFGQIIILTETTHYIWNIGLSLLHFCLFAAADYLDP